MSLEQETIVRCVPVSYVEREFSSFRSASGDEVPAGITRVVHAVPLDGEGAPFELRCSEKKLHLFELLKSARFEDCEVVCAVFARGNRIVRSVQEFSVLDPADA